MKSLKLTPLLLLLCACDSYDTTDSMLTAELPASLTHIVRFAPKNPAQAWATDTKEGRTQLALLRQSNRALTQVLDNVATALTNDAMKEILADKEMTGLPIAVDVVIAPAESPRGAVGGFALTMIATPSGGGTPDSMALTMKTKIEDMHGVVVGASDHHDQFVKAQAEKAENARLRREKLDAAQKAATTEPYFKILGSTAQQMP